MTTHGIADDPIDADVRRLRLEEGLGGPAIAARLGVTHHRVRRIVERLGLPPAKRGYPPSGEARVRVPVTLTAAELAAVDAARGTRPRAEWLRDHALRASALLTLTRTAAGWAAVADAYGHEGRGEGAEQDEAIGRALVGLGEAMMAASGGGEGE